jgi:hypothetical protein
MQDSMVIEIADANLCARVCREIHALHPLWRAWSLNGQPPFYTLGAASYLELGFARRSISDYLSGAGLLWNSGEAICALLERVRKGVEDLLGAPVDYPAELPTPGFHLFIGPSIPLRDCRRDVADCGSTHFDMQYEHIPWTRWYERVNLEDTISFTLALKLPEAGGCLALWKSLNLDLLRRNLPGHSFADLPAAANVARCSLIPYSVGTMVLHNGKLLHQIAGVSTAGPHEERITLQGHGVFADGAWRLYW